MLDPRALSLPGRGSIIAPAGCGKTQLIAETVKQMGDGRALLLTHTHAGVAALKGRLRKLDVPSGKAKVETLAGWCLRYASSYPGQSGIKATEPESNTEWDSVYAGAAALLKIRAIREVVKATYNCAFIDEYQDCTPLQHDLAVALADTLPCRVFGDPLQGIFEFGGANLSWSGDVEQVFPRQGELTTPWRWAGRNENLGRWLLILREKLIRGEPIDLSDAPLTWAKSTREEQAKAAYRLLRQPGKVAVIRKWAEMAHSFARGIGGAFLSMEPTECADLMAFTRRLDEATGPSRALCILDLADACMTKVKTDLGPVRKIIEEGRGSSRLRKNTTVLDALQVVAGSGDVTAVVAAMGEIEKVPGAKVFRSELWREASRVLLESDRAGESSLQRTAWRLRNQLRTLGRPICNRSVSRTLLIKGLEVDHAMVLNAEEFEDRKRLGDGAKHFYVAATRGSRSLTVLSNSPTVQFTIPRL